MKVLWFEITVPSRYRNNGKVTAGWQDSLEKILSKNKEIELFVAFEVKEPSDVKVIDGITYIPIFLNYSWIETKLLDFSWYYEAEKLIPSCISIIKQYSPDVIHVFGNEWPFGLVAKYTDLPLVIHIQGSIIPYHNALYPPNYSTFTIVKYCGFNLLKQFRFLKSYLKELSRVKMEREVWKSVDNYMGRTVWDWALVNTLHPNSSYWHVDEALRPVFFNSAKHWSYKKREKIVLFTIGISSFWKGPDMLLKTANILKKMGVPFEWYVAGQMNDEIKHIVEKKENLRFKENNIKVLGFLTPKELIDRLCESSLYVHTAYIDNSPNSICEAQILGVPVVSTNVGGIESLVHNNVDGVLVPANDPWRLAHTIYVHINNPEVLIRYSTNAQINAQKRHLVTNIETQLLTCYNEIINKYNEKDNS